MWIIKVALDRPYTFIVLALLILIVEPGGDFPHTDRYLSQHRYSGRSPSPGIIPA